jgi:predicted secreted protein
MPKPSPWTGVIADARSREVVFLSHCLLNANTRYLGGAGHAGPAPQVVAECLARGVGIVQLPCPEARAWGGVEKRRLLAFFGSEGTWLFRLRKVLLPLALAYTRFVYRRLARAVAREIADYHQAGYKVRALVGVDGSPSCGVGVTLRVAPTLTRLARLRRETASAATVREAVRAGEVPGEGLFVTSLRAELARRGLEVPWVAYSLRAELEGEPQPFLHQGLGGSDP